MRGRNHFTDVVRNLNRVYVTPRTRNRDTETAQLRLETNKKQGTECILKLINELTQYMCTQRGKTTMTEK